MGTAKEEAQAARVAQNAENQRRQDEFGYAVATHTDPAKAKGRDLATKTRERNAEEIARDQETQTPNDDALPEDALVSTAVKGKGKKDYAEKNLVQKDLSAISIAPEARAYEAVAETDEETDADASAELETKGAKAEVSSAKKK